MHFIAYIVVVTVCPLLCGLAVFKGGPAERYGAIMLFVPAALETALMPFARDFGYSTARLAPYIDLLSTFANCAGFLYLAIRFASLWLAAAMVVEGTELYFARAYIDADPPNYHLYALEVNLITIMVALLLSGGALWSWRARIRKRHDDQKRDAAMIEREQARDRKFKAMFESQPPPAAPAARPSGGVARLIIEPPPI